MGRVGGCMSWSILYTVYLFTDREALQELRSNDEYKYKYSSLHLLNNNVSSLLLFDLSICLSIYLSVSQSVSQPVT